MAKKKTFTTLLYEQTLEQMEAMKLEYGIDELEDRITDKAKKILVAQTDKDALIAKSKALASCSIHCIAHGMRRTASWYDRQAEKCESRRLSLFRKGDDEGAEKQLQYKQRYEAKARELRSTE